jgi:putative serine protease PepD
VVGAYIEDVTNGGAAQKAGIRQGDIVTQFNGVRITDANDLTAQVRTAAGGSEATLVYLRGGKTETVKVILGTL